MELKPGYKQTEIGVIPEDWDFIQLKKCIDLKNGYAFQSAFFSNRGEVLLTPGNFSRTGGLQFDSNNTKRYNGKFPKDSVLSYGDLLLVMTDLTPDCKLLGKPAIVKTKETFLHNQRIAKVVNNQRKAVNGFLFYVFLSEHYLRYLKERATGSTVRHTSLRIISSFRTALPPKKEQIAVSKTLFDIDSLITSLEKLIEKKKFIKHGVMQELLTGTRRLPGFSGEWETKRLGDFFALQYGKPKKESDRVKTAGVPVYGSNGVVGYSSDKLTSNPTIIIGRKGAAGLVHHSSGGCWPIDTTFYIEFDDYTESLFYYYLLQCAGLDRIKSDSAVPGLNRADAYALMITVPSKEERIQIAEILLSIDQEITYLTDSLDKHKLLKQAMMQELLTGRIRLV